MVDAVRLWSGSRAEAISPLAGDRLAEVLPALRVGMRDVREIDESICLARRLRDGSLASLALYQMDVFLLGPPLTLSLSLHSLLSWRTYLGPWSLAGSWHQGTRRDLALKIAALKKLKSEKLLLLGQLVANPDLSLQNTPSFRPLLVQRTYFSRFVLPLVGYTIAGVVMARLLCRLDWRRSLALVKDLCLASQNLVQDWIVGPIMEIWRTVRYKNSKLALISPAALQGDIDSLERMVLAFARHQEPAVPDATVTDLVRQGDLSLLLKQYEQDMKRPWRSILSGNLITLILIQVQKGKVDLQSAMMAMDKLLKSNELNFELMAVLPLMAIIYVAAAAGRDHLSHYLQRPQRQIFSTLRDNMRSIELVLNSNEHPDFVMGTLLIRVQSLLDAWHQLPSAFGLQYQEEFMEDLAELLADKSASSKLWTVARMFHFYPFLLPRHK